MMMMMKISSVEKGMCKPRLLLHMHYAHLIRELWSTKGVRPTQSQLFFGRALGQPI